MIRVPLFYSRIERKLFAGFRWVFPIELKPVRINKTADMATYQREYQRKYYHDNPERKAYLQAYRQRTREYRKAYNREWERLHRADRNTYYRERYNRIKKET